MDILLANWRPVDIIPSTASIFPLVRLESGGVRRGIFNIVEGIVLTTRKVGAASRQLVASCLENNKNGQVKDKIAH